MLRAPPSKGRGADPRLGMIVNNDMYEGQRCDAGRHPMI